MNAERDGKIIYWLLLLAGILSCLWHARSATRDVVYSDYIRLVNSYLPGVWNPDKFLVPDALTRIPTNYLCRIVNVKFFGFTVTLERILGVVSLGLAGWVFAAYGRSRKIGCPWFVLLMAVTFSLNRWGMLINGNRWSHFFAFARFYHHELVLDQVWAGEEKKHDRLKLLALPWLIILGIAGPYCGVYAVMLLLSYGFCMVIDRRESRGCPGRGGWGSWDTRYLACMACALIPSLLYMLSNSMAVKEHVGATGHSLGTILAKNPTFPVRLLLKSSSGVLVGGEELERFIGKGPPGNQMCYVPGLFVVCGYLMASWLNSRSRLYGRTVTPFMLLAGGGMNHIIVFISRYIFEKENYALSSRYALQSQVGVLGVILTFALVWQLRERTNRGYRWFMTLFCLAVLMGNGYATYREIQKMPSREESLERKARLALEVPEMSREKLRDRGKELETGFEYRKGLDKIQSAFRILEENKLNVFREYNGGRR